MDYAQMLNAVQEMAANQLVIISDNDREFILGIDMLVEMQENVPASYIPRVEKIYAEFQRNQML